MSKPIFCDLDSGNPFVGRDYQADVNHSALGRAICNGEICVQYQPIVDCLTGDVVRFEALARWRLSGKGLIPPDRFIPIAEKSQLIQPLTRSVMEQAINWLARSTNHTQGMSIAVNLSPAVIRREGFADWLFLTCNNLGVAPARIELELTESQRLSSGASVMELARLRKMGFGLSMDDFGTGYCSILQMTQLPFSSVKIDRRFLARVKESKEARAIVRSMIDLGHSKSLVVTAEGIENLSQLEFLVDWGCDLAQGFLISRPLNGGEVASWLAHSAPAFRRPLTRSSGASGWAFTVSKHSIVPANMDFETVGIGI